MIKESMPPIFELSGVPRPVTHSTCYNWLGAHPCGRSCQVMTGEMCIDSTDSRRWAQWGRCQLWMWAPMSDFWNRERQKGKSAAGSTDGCSVASTKGTCDRILVQWYQHLLFLENAASATSATKCWRNARPLAHSYTNRTSYTSALLRKM
jgi:hypothetical protein